uniref:Uncharacterized protein n=1 Tax=Tanacetum cinerariifolium TaxID=118510 RepID=A0A6L2LQD3_TANCI|nr:hypothetical protein [Tanacetum cinerariifolium]
MPGSQPREMASESSQAVVILKFDMHIHTSTFTTKEFKQAITDYCIPTDLHPRLPSPELTMDKLLPSVIGIYLKQLEQVSADRCKQSDPVRDQRAIPDAMPWRHTDTNVRDDFPTNYNEADADPDVGKEVVDLSENTRVPTTPPVHTTQEEQFEHGNTQVHVVYSDAHSFHSVHNEDNDEDATTYRYVPEWGLREDLRICSYRACKELISHLATPAQDEVLSSLSNYETDLQREMQTNDGQSKKHALLENDYSQCSDRERELMDSLKDMEKERDNWRKTASNQVIREFVPAVVSRLHSIVEYQKSLAVPIGMCFTAGSKAWKDKHREHFTKQYPYFQKVADSYRLPLDELMKISLNVSPSKDDQGGTLVQNVNGGSTNPTLEDAPPS